jgi:hypothetical protein
LLASILPLLAQFSTYCCVLAEVVLQDGNALCAASSKAKHLYLLELNEPLGKKLHHQLRRVVSHCPLTELQIYLANKNGSSIFKKRFS